MASYYLNRERMRVVKRNDKGNVTYRKRYRFGDKVDVDHLEEGRTEALVESGALVTSKDDLKSRRAGAVPRPGSQVTGGATREAADHSEIADEDDYGPEEEQTEFDVEDEESDSEASLTDGADADENDVEPADEYASMDYRELQAAARNKDINPSQSAEALREALRNS